MAGNPLMQLIEYPDREKLSIELASKIAGDLNAAGGRYFQLGTGTICILGFERGQRAIARWNAPTNGLF